MGGAKCAADKASYREAMRVHAMRAAFNRFGFALAIPDYERLVAEVRDGTAKFIAPGGRLKRDIYLIVYRGRRFYAVYDPSHDAIVTVVPQEFPPGRRRRPASAPWPIPPCAPR